MSELHPLLEMHFPTLAGVDDAEGRAILSEAMLLEVPPGQSVFRVGDPCQNFLMVAAGQVKVIGRGSSGREILLYRIDQGGTCVLTTACLMGHDAYPAEGITETTVQAFAIPRQRFEQALAGSEGLRRFVFASYGERLSDLIRLVQQLAFERIDLRLARYLIENCRERIELQVTHQQLAIELGSAREVVSRQLKSFERQGWISLGRGTIRVEHLAGLETLLDCQG
ncbi:Crp/Fnr family transcriptional regulator [Motiliproteus coralliicola]|uniref:Crp/Fnr family transcriptional regulator n=1 Tax=Motiliproteus coralliicola TaxID=2283196 RepID=A0A369WBQ6_9GAMM|nr:Crp/Fnr family transcriptional regulator [Motiliproteus coralliicola]RDE18743.1 Crp/Fnr family transcriptional regulator [Motiliproteus coralliicola]